MIKKIEGLEQSVHYDHNTHEHYHFICDSCKKVYDIDARITFDENTQQEFTIHGYDIAFHGLCKNCQQKINKKQCKGEHYEKIQMHSMWLRL